MKKCCKCKIVKELQEFPKRYDCNGISSWCLGCFSGYMRAYRSTKKAKLAHVKSVRAYEANNREKKNAQVKLRRAVKSGRVGKFPCAVCGSLESEGHHPDYAKPLSVIWLCCFHHKKVHIPIKESQQ